MRPGQLSDDEIIANKYLAKFHLRSVNTQEVKQNATFSNTDTSRGRD